MKTARTTRTSPQALSLPQRLQALEVERHAGRLTDIRRMHARLVLLDAFMPAIEAAGIFLSLGDVTDWGGKSLSLSAGLLDPKSAAKLVNVLVANGMKVDERRDWAHRDLGHSTFYLKKGRLQVSVMVDRSVGHLLEVPACA